MCGIVGYVGNRKAADLVYTGLSRLEYRGYDSSGIATLSQSKRKIYTQLVREVGKLEFLRPRLSELDSSARQAIGHTRWATHGTATLNNTHPHRWGPITIVHNGIIENHRELRNELMKKGSQLQSNTDSEIFAHLVASLRESGLSLTESIRQAFARIKGASAFVVMDETSPGTIVAIRRGSPLVVGLGKEENFVASDVPAIIDSVKEVYYLEDEELAEICETTVAIQDALGRSKAFEAVEVNWRTEGLDKGEFDHHMLKEIFEQPEALKKTLQSWINKEDRLQLGAFSQNKGGQWTEASVLKVFTEAPLIQIVACGTAAHAGFFAAQDLENRARLQTRAEIASEFRYRNPLLKPGTLGLVISQSGETADTLAAVREMKAQGLHVFAITNVKESSIARECDVTFYTHAGPEIGVASTKAFTTQLALLMALTSVLAEAQGLSCTEEAENWGSAMKSLPDLCLQTLECAPEMRDLAQKHQNHKTYLFLGRGPYFPIAMEGALKLKEISYVHAESFAAGELKHGPIAMIEPDVLTFAISPDPQSVHHLKSVSNFEEVKARHGELISLCSSMDEQMRTIGSNWVDIPSCAFPQVAPILATIPLQLFAYEMAVSKGTEIDRPRNLAKSVTVE